MKKYIIKHSFLILFIFFTPLLVANNETSTILRGKVIDQYNKALDAAQIHLLNTSESTFSNETGDYKLAIKPGQYTLMCTLIGHETFVESIIIEPGKEVNKNITLKGLELDEVIVLGKSRLQKINESAYNVVAIDTKDLYNSTLGVSSALDRISGVKIREVGGLGSETQVNLNGFTGKHIKLFMDGVPMEGAGSSFQINNIPIHLTERIEVYKGLVPIEFGADALGGAINIVTKKTNRSYIDASYSYGSFNTHKTNVSLGHTSKSGFTFQLNAYQNYSDNDYKVKTKLLNLKTNTYSKEEHWFKRFHDNYHNEAIVSKIGIVNKPWATQLLFGATYSQEKADIQNANLLQIVYGGRKRKAKSFIPSLTYSVNNIGLQNLNLSLMANYNKVRNNNIDTLARQYNWKGEYRNKGTKGEGQYSLGEYNNRSSFITSNLNYQLHHKHYFTLNNVFSTFSRKATDVVANHENSTEATFMKRKNEKNILGFSYHFEPNRKWNTLFFIKQYNIKIKGPINVSETTTASYQEKEKKYKTTGYGFAATYFITPSLQLKSSYEKAYRLPSDRELFGDEVLETGDASLKPEDSKNLNFNLRYSSSFCKNHSIYLDAGFIYRDTRNYIRRQIEQRYGGAYYTNHGKVRNLGIDLEARYFYKHLFSIGGNLTYQNIRNRERFSATGQKLIYYKDRMPNVPYLFSNIDASYNIHNLLGQGNVLTLGYNIRHINKFFKDWQSEGGNITIPNQLSHDLNATYSFKNGRYNMAFEVRNLTNERLYDNYSLQKPGRSFSVKLRYFLQK